MRTVCVNTHVVGKHVVGKHVVGIMSEVEIVAVEGIDNRCETSGSTSSKASASGNILPLEISSLF